MVLVRKKTGELRFCVDFRKLNDLADLDGYKLPKISELKSKLSTQRYFTLIDLKDGFFQILLRKEDREKTPFSTKVRLVQFTKMPQWFKNSLAVFQRTMTIILKGLLENMYF